MGGVTLKLREQLLTRLIAEDTPPEKIKQEMRDFDDLFAEELTDEQRYEMMQDKETLESLKRGY